MTAHIKVSQAHIDELSEAVRELRDENDNLSLSAAFNRVAAEWLGYEFDDDDLEDVFIDGAGDHGIDFWFASDTGIDVYQAKTHQGETGLDLVSPFGIDGVNDLERARIFLTAGLTSEVKNQGLRRLQHEWSRIINNRQVYAQTQSDGHDLRVTLNLIVLGEGLTPQAQQQFEMLQSDLSSPVEVLGVRVRFSAALYTVYDLAHIRWLEQPDTKRDNFRLDLNLLETSGYINDQFGAVFYCRAVDLVRAYDEHGYILFAANVRANIKKSKINNSIRATVSRRRGRHEFRFLNNGVTVICSGYRKPSDGRSTFRLHNPNIVNGLQTVVALHTAYYKELSPEDQRDFEDNCYVLARVLDTSAASRVDVDAIVLATNTQNPMQPRNLRSNEKEQIQNVRFFAQKGWFYENKQGAWEAFKENPRQWRPHLGVAVSHFRSGRRERRIDNEELAQSWLSFCGFSYEAANLRRQLFEDKYYNFVFQRRTYHHGSDYGFDYKAAVADAVEGPPNASIMLVAYLTTQFQKKIVPSARQIREEALNRVKQSRDISRRDREQLLTEDAEYVKWQALRGMRLVFTETVGYVLFQSLGEYIYDLAGDILRNGTFRYLADSYDLAAAAEAVRKEQFAYDDILPRLWLAFEDSVGGLVEIGQWGTGFVEATVKSRYVLKPASRKAIYDDLDEQDKYIQRSGGRRLWHAGIPEGQGLYDFIYHTLVKP